MADDVTLLCGGVEKHHLILNIYCSDQKNQYGYVFGGKMFLRRA